MEEHVGVALLEVSATAAADEKSLGEEGREGGKEGGKEGDKWE